MKRILIVDDKDENVYYLNALLTGNGFTVDSARHGAEALVKARLAMPNLIVSDLLMPVMDGYTLLRLWKADARLKQIPFIVYTATYTEPEDERLALSLGADAFILKPAEPEDFLERIRQVQANAAARIPTPAKHPAGDEKELLKVYSEALIRKLEEKTLQLEDSNRALLADVAQRKRTELEREQYFKFFQISSDLMVFADPQGCFKKVNPACLQALGYSETELLGKPFLDFVHPDDRASTAAEMARQIQTGSSLNFINRYLCKDGSIRWLAWRATYVADEGQTYGTARDITERQQSEAALRLLNSAVVQTKESIMITDAELDLPGPKIVFVNPAFTQMTGYTAEEVLGKTPRILQGPHTDKAVLRKLRENLERGEVFEGEAINYRKDGSEYIQEWQITPLHDVGGKITHFVAIQREITERKRVEEELRWKTTFLEAKVESSLDGILVVDSEGKKISQNQRLVDLWKIPPHIAENKDDALQVEFITNQTKNPLEFLSKVAHLNSHRDEVSRDEIELMDGTILDRYSSPVRDKTGKYYGRIWTFRDITSQRKLEAQFRQSQKMEAFGQLAGGVAHDFNNILAIIQMQAGLLKLEQNLSLEQRDFAGEIEQAAQRGASLTRQLLLFSRKQTMQPRELKLKDVVDNMTKMLQRTLGEKIQLRFKFSEDPICIHADPGMIDQILLNLTVNARDAMPKGGEIVIETAALEFAEGTIPPIAPARPGLFACLSVTDNGCGIAPEILPRIFEPFFTTKDVGKGTGLGLATVFGIVQQHKGWINVQSEVGRGTTFRIYLPHLAESTDTKIIRAAQASLRGGDETILLVEDEFALRVSVRTTLNRLGYRVLEAETGDEALKIWQQHRDEISLLLTDLVMPGELTGKELAEQFLAEAPQLKVIYTSGYSADIAGRDLMLEDGANFLTKPFQAHNLARTIRAKLDQPDPSAPQ